MNDSVFFDEENKVSVARYEGYLKLEEFQFIATEVQKLRRSKSPNIQLVIVDDMKVLSPEIQAWINSDWFPLAIKTGLKFLGFIVPKSVIAKNEYEICQ